MIVVLPLQFYISVPIPLRWQTLHRGNPETGWPPHPLKLPGVVLSPGGGAHWILQARCPPGIHWNGLLVASCPQGPSEAVHSSPALQRRRRAQDSSATRRGAEAHLPTPHLALPNLDLCHLLLAHPRKQGQGPFLRIPPTSTYISRPPNSAPKPRDSDKPHYSSSYSSPDLSLCLPFL